MTARFAAANLAISWGSRPKPLITWMPCTASESVRISRSTSSLLRKYSGLTEREKMIAPIHKNGVDARHASVKGTCTDSM